MLKPFIFPVEEILARTAHEEVQKIYNLPEFTSTLEFLTMLALSSGRLLKVCAFLEHRRLGLTSRFRAALPISLQLHARC